MVAAVNEGEGDPDVIASPGQIGFFSARATITFNGEPRVGDTVTLSIGGRFYLVIVTEDDTLTSIRNKLVFEVNSGRGDPEVTARRLVQPGNVEMQVVARELGTDGNGIPFDITLSPDGSTMMVETDVEDNVLEGGRNAAGSIPHRPRSRPPRKRNRLLDEHFGQRPAFSLRPTGAISVAETKSFRW